MIRCIAIDDEPLALRQITGYIEKTPYLQLIGGFTSAIKAIEFLHENDIDLMFVDINMPDISGLELVKSLSSAPKVVFTTAYQEYAYEGFKVDAADYLVKPIGYSDFLSSADKVKERYFTKKESKEVLSKNDQFLFIKSEYKLVRINFNDIKYIEGMRDYIRIHLENQNPIMSLMGIKRTLDYLPEDSFMRVHRSFIVNLNKITVVERGRIIFDSKTFIPISDQYKNQFQEYLDNNFLK